MPSRQRPAGRGSATRPRCSPPRRRSPGHSRRRRRASREGRREAAAARAGPPGPRLSWVRDGAPFAPRGVKQAAREGRRGGPAAARPGPSWHWRRGDTGVAARAIGRPSGGRPSRRPRPLPPVVEPPASPAPACWTDGCGHRLCGTGLEWVLSRRRAASGAGRRWEAEPPPVPRVPHPRPAGGHRRRPAGAGGNRAGTISQIGRLPFDISRRRPDGCGCGRAGQRLRDSGHLVAGLRATAWRSGQGQRSGSRAGPPDVVHASVLSPSSQHGPGRAAGGQQAQAFVQPAVGVPAWVQPGHRGGSP